MNLILRAKREASGPQPTGLDETTKKVGPLASRGPFSVEMGPQRRANRDRQNSQISRPK